MGTAAESKEALNQVRDILFGAIQHEFERRLGRVEAHFASRVTELQQETRRRTEVIEAHLRKETEALAARVEGEFVEIREHLRALTRDHRETAAATEQRVTKTEDTLARAQHEIRQQILNQTKEFLDEVQAVRTELSATLERELGSLEILSDEEGGTESREKLGADERASP